MVAFESPDLRALVEGIADDPRWLGGVGALVLSTSGRACTVAQFTSRDRDERRDHRRVPDGVPGLSRSSWVRLRPVRVPRSVMRRRAGTPGLALVTWYESVGVH